MFPVVVVVVYQTVLESLKLDTVNLLLLRIAGRKNNPKLFPASLSAKKKKNMDPFCELSRNITV